MRSSLNQPVSILPKSVAFSAPFTGVTTPNPMLSPSTQGNVFASGEYDF